MCLNGLHIHSRMTCRHYLPLYPHLAYPHSLSSVRHVLSVCLPVGIPSWSASWQGRLRGLQYRGLAVTFFFYLDRRYGLFSGWRALEMFGLARSGGLHAFRLAQVVPDEVLRQV